MLDVRTNCRLRLSRSQRTSSDEALRTTRTQVSRPEGPSRKRVRRIRLSRSRTTRNVKHHRFANPPPHAGSCTVAFPGAVFRYLGAKPSRPGRTMGPSLLALSSPLAPSSLVAGGAHGVLVLRDSKPLVCGRLQSFFFLRFVQTHLPWACASQTGFDFAPVVKR